MKTCRTCGIPSSDDASFCLNCGMKLPDHTSQDVASSELPVNEETTVAENAYDAVNEADNAECPTDSILQYEEDPPAQYSEAKTPKKSAISSKVLAAVLVGLSAVAVLLLVLSSIGKSHANRDYAEDRSDAVPSITDPADEDQSDPIAKISMSFVIGVTATSHLEEPEYDLVHLPEYVMDGELSNAWVEGVSGAGIGQSFTLMFNSSYIVEGFSIHAGYQKSDELFEANCRPKVLTVKFSDGTAETVNLDDVNAEQTITFSSPVETSSIEFEITDVYPGAKYMDTVISEIELF